MDKERLYQLKNEIKMAQALNKEELEPIITEAIGRYTGAWTPPQYLQDWDIALNEIYPVIQNELPAIFFRNPRAFLKPTTKYYIAKVRDPISEKMVEVQMDASMSAKTQEQILNYSVDNIGYKKEARKVLFDALLCTHGVLWHGYKGNFGMTEEQSLYIESEQVFVRRIQPLRFIKDPSVNMSNLDEAKWVGRIIDIPMIDLIEDDKLDVDKKLIKGFKGYGEKIGKNSYNNTKWLGEVTRSAIDYVKTRDITYKGLIDFADEQYKNSKAAQFVRVFEIFLRPTKKELREGSKGKILLLTDEQEKPLRENDWTIKTAGWPAKVLTFNELPDSQFSLSDIAVYGSIVDQKNIITNLQIRNAQEMTKTWVAIAKQTGAEEDIKRIQEGTNSIIMFDSDSVKDRMNVFSPGGSASNELYMFTNTIQKNLEDKSGVTDLKRGVLQSGEESAASVKIRTAGGSARPAYRQDLMADFLKESFYYLNGLIKQFMPYEEAVRIMGTTDISWSEKPTKEGMQADVSVELDVISMLPENPDKELQDLNVILGMTVQAINDPGVRTKLLQEGKIMNLAPLIEQILLRRKINDSDIFRNIKPEESMGYASVQQLRQAQQNVTAAISGQQIPFPPQPNDDHAVKLEVYGAAKELLAAAGQISDMLEQMIQIQSALLAQIQEKEGGAGMPVKMSNPSVRTV